MARLNTANALPLTTSFVRTEPHPSGITALNAPGYTRDAHSALYLLGVTFFAGESAHHETAEDRMARFVGLVRELAVADPHWTARFLRWLRQDVHIRTAAIVGAAEFVKARKDAGVVEDSHARCERGLGRQVVDSVLRRADEPTEIVAYWTTHYGRQIPKALRRGVMDAVGRLWNERALLKWDSGERAWRFADVLSLLHCRPTAPWQSGVFKHALDRRHGNHDAPLPDNLTVLRRRRELMSMPVEQRRPWLLATAADTDDADVGYELRSAGMTWESLAGWLQGPMDAAAWEAIIPAMGCMALIRNLRNFDQANVSDEVARRVGEKISDPEEVAASQLLPFRYLAAYRAAPSLRWTWPLEQALGHSLRNIPTLPGRSLILVDRSPSMWHTTMSQHSTMSWADGAAVFGAALALAAERADLVQFGQDNARVDLVPGESLLKLVNRFGRFNGTNIPQAVKAHYRAEVHDRVVIVTDEQTQPGMLPYWEFVNGGFYGRKEYLDIDTVVDRKTPVYVWNFGGYEHGMTETGTTNRHCFGGLTDNGFHLIPLLEKGRSAGWPF